MPTNFQELVSTELKKFNVTDIAIAELSKNYMSLTINGIEDTEGYQQVKDGKIFIKKKRIEVEKVRKELKEDSLTYGRKVDAEAKRITQLLAPIEDYLERLQKNIDDEKERIKQEQALKQQQLVQSRIDKFQQVGKRVEYAVLSLMTDEVFEIQLQHATQEFNQEQIRIKQEAETARIKREAEEEAYRQERERLLEERRIESERVAVIAKQQETEKLRLESIAKELAEKEEAINLEKARINATSLEEERAKKERLQANKTNKNDAEINHKPLLEKKIYKVRVSFDEIWDSEADDENSAIQQIKEWISEDSKFYKTLGYKIVCIENKSLEMANG